MKPLVGIIMGSDSDLKIMKEAAEALDELGVPYEMTIVSAHRTPHRMIEYAESARARGLKVIIAGAGGAAHLPGMVAWVGFSFVYFANAFWCSCGNCGIRWCKKCRNFGCRNYRCLQ